VDTEVLAEYRRLAGEIKRNREALAGLLDRVKQPDGSLKLTKAAQSTWARLDKEYDRDRRALRKLLAGKKATGKTPPGKPATG
jgi:hypothetical protein